MGMAVGLEIREPYFDSALWEYLLSIPGSLKLSYPSKRLLTDALYPLLPAELITRKKRGFVLPWQKWMQGEMKSFCEKEIAEFSERNAVQGAAVLRDWNAFNRNDPSVRWIHIWQLVVLNTWLKKMQLDI
jgi:asparagine synthase (glutamine-hydrolysing)